ncbi:hypothetical protein PINS_up019332 [Pythium insidiosum]|nr:hypothetical protein PINS_up019332 [Pythium insidiosum]
MPLAVTSSSSRMGDRSDNGADLAARGSRGTLRQVSSEKSFGRTTKPPDLLTKPPDEPCPFVVCDVSAEDPEPDRDVRTQQCNVKTVQVKKKLTSDDSKVRPFHEDTNDDFPRQQQPRSLNSGRIQRCDTLEFDRDTKQVESAAPILKDFFHRNSATAQQEREQLRLHRRELHYRNSAQRHERIRRRIEEREKEEAAQFRQMRIERMRRAQLDRKLQLRQEASQVKRQLQQLSVSEDNSYRTERERWELEFHDEMQMLEGAYRKTQARLQATGEADRPLTVAGLPVPVAKSELAREQGGFSRRVHTAAPAGWKSDGHESRPTRDSGEAQFLEDEVLGLFTDDSTTAVPLSSVPLRFQDEVDVEALLREREALLGRIAELEQQIDRQHLPAMAE